MEKKNILGFALGPIGTAIVGFISIPIVAWLFSPEDIGRISMLQVAISFAVIFFSLGLDQAYVREYHETIIVEKPRLLITNAIPGILILILFCLIFLYFSPTFFSKALFSINSISLSIVVALCMFAELLSRFTALILRMEEKGLAFSMSQLLPKIIYLSIILIYAVSSNTYNFEKLIFAYSISLLITLSIYLWYTKTMWSLALMTKIDISKLRQMLKFGIPLIFGGLASWALMAMDKIFLRNMSTLSELGFYSIALSIASAVSIFTGIFNTIWAPTAYKLVSSGISHDKIDEITEHVLAAVIAVIIFAGLFSWVVMYILPPQYENIQYIVTACMAAPLFYTISETTVIGIAIKRRMIYSMLASFIAAGISLVCNYLLIPKLGATGASISTAIAFWFFLIARTEFSSLVWRPLPKRKLYMSSFGILILLIGFALLGEAMPVMWSLIWGVTAILWFFIFKNSIHLLIKEIKNYYQTAT